MKKPLYKVDTTKEGCTHWLLKDVMLLVNKDIKPIKSPNGKKSIK